MNQDKPQKDLRPQLIVLTLIIIIVSTFKKCNHMENPKQEYEKKRDSILKSEQLSEAEKSNQLFGNWIEYITNSATITEGQALKYEAEKTRVYARS